MIILKNNTQEDVFIEDLGIELYPNDEIEISIDEANNSLDLENLIKQRKIIINDGFQDVYNIQEALGLIKIQSQELDIRNDFIKFKLQKNEKIIIPPNSQYLIMNRKELILEEGSELQLREGAEIYLINI